MLADLTPIIQHGIIDNTAEGHIRLLLWCEGESTPVSLEMDGNCLRDIAGCRVTFRITAAVEDSQKHLQALSEMVQHLRHAEEPIIAGDMTLSRRFPLPPHGRMANILSLEFFQGAKVRFLIETEEFTSEVGLPEWVCTQAKDNAQQVVNMSALHDHVLANVAAFRGPSLMYLGTENMPACRWDYALNRAEAYMLIAPSIRAKYAGHPRGRFAEAFVLDLLDYLDTAAEEEEHGDAIHSADNAPRWELLDFLDAPSSRLARQSMQHPLFGAAAHLSQIIQKHIIAKLSQYQDCKEIEALLMTYSGIISHVLATIMLAREGQAQIGASTSRGETLCERMQMLVTYGEALKPQARKAFLRGAESLITELREFLCMLRK